MFGPPAQDLVGAVVATATRHARRGLVDLKPRGVERGGLIKKDEAGRGVMCKGKSFLDM